MNSPRWLYPGLKIKRWLFLLVLCAIVGIIGLAGVLSSFLHGLKIEIIPQTEVDKITTYLKGLKFIDIVAIILGTMGITIAFRMIIKVFTMAFIPEKSEDFMDISYKRLLLRKGPKVVAIGGGTGLPAVLEGLKEYTSNITAIVTVADDGGSSGTLRQVFKIPPPGDIRNCLVALADVSPLMSNLFQYRFKHNSEFKGHNFGNLFITAMSELTGDFEKAIKESSRVLAIRGSVVPVTLEHVTLGAKLIDNRFVDGETNISQSKSPIDRVFLKPENVKPTDEALIAIREADVIVFGPGSLYTSIIPNLLVEKVIEEITSSKAAKIYVCNIMTQPGETTGYNLTDHINSIVKHSRQGLFEYVIINTELLPPEMLAKYAEEGAVPVELDEESLKLKNYSLVKARILSLHNYARHDPTKLARCIIKIISM